MTFVCEGHIASLILLSFRFQRTVDDGFVSAKCGMQFTQPSKYHFGIATFLPSALCKSVVRIQRHAAGATFDLPAHCGQHLVS